MKRKVIAGVLILSLGLFTISCKENNKSTEHEKTEHHEHEKAEHHEDVGSDTEMKHSEIAAAEYQCPMKCEKEKTYHEQGSCPVCKMDLKEVKKDTTE